MNISEMLVKLGLSADDQKLVEKAITDLVTESVATKEEALKTKYELLSEEYVKSKLAEKEAELTVSLTESNDEWRKEFESGMIDKIDQFLDSEIEAKISDSLLEDVAYLQIAKPIVESIKKVYEDNHVSLDSEGLKVIKEAKEQVEALKEDLSEAINAKMEAEKLAEGAATKLRITEAVVGLSKEESEKVKTIFEGKSFAEVDQKIGGYVSLLIEEKTKAENAAGKAEATKSVILEQDETLIVEEAKPSPLTIEDMASSFI